MKKISGHSKVWIILFILAVLSTLLLSLAYKDGVNATVQSTKGINSNTSLAEVENSAIGIKLPDIVKSKSTDKDFKITNVMGQVYQIQCNEFVIKIAAYTDYRADTLGLYDSCSVDKIYTVSDNQSDITYFRYRQEYKGYEHCTIINWCTSTAQYGMMYADKISIDEALDIIGIDKGSLIAYTDAVSSNSLQGNVLTLSNGVTLELPNFESTVSILDYDNGLCEGSVNNKTLFIIDYGNGTDRYKSEQVVDLNNSIKLYYSKENPFSTGTKEYSDYELLIKSIQHIKDSIKNK